MHWLAGLLAFFGLTTAQPQHPPVPPKTFLVTQSIVSDEKAVFATVESANVVPARARIGGTVIALKVRQGDRVDRGEVIATVGDERLGIEVNSYAAQVSAAQAQLAEAKLEFERAEHLVGSGIVSKNQYDQDRTAYGVAQNNLKSIEAQRAVAAQQVAQGSVLAPAAGRIITVPVTSGTVVMPGDTIATVADQNFVLRLEVPERHARFIKAGDRVRVDGGDLGLGSANFGTIVLVYPKIESGRVEADATVVGLEDYFVGERVRVWVSAGKRDAIIVPASLITTRSGIDYAKLWTAQDGAMDVPVQRGEIVHRPGVPDGLEILSGLGPGDRLLRP